MGFPDTKRRLPPVPWKVSNRVLLCATRRTAGRRQASDGAGGDRNRDVHVANLWPRRGGRHRSRRGEEVSDLEQAPTDGAIRRVVDGQPPRLGAQLRCGLVTSRRPSGRRLGVSEGGSRMKWRKRDVSEQGRAGHEPPHAGLVRSGAGRYARLLRYVKATERMVYRDRRKWYQDTLNGRERTGRVEGCAASTAWWGPTRRRSSRA